MSAEQDQLKALAAEHGSNALVVQALLADLCAQAHADHFYVFCTAGAGSELPAIQRQRVLLAFLTPDAALVFAQRNDLASGRAQPRLRRLSLFQLVSATLHEPAIVALLLVGDLDEQSLVAGHLPSGLRIERVAMLRRLQGETAI